MARLFPLAVNPDVLWVRLTEGNRAKRIDPHGRRIAKNCKSGDLSCMMVELFLKVIDSFDLLERIHFRLHRLSNAQDCQGRVVILQA